MPSDLMIFSGPLFQRQASLEITKYNEVTRQHGLTLTEQQAVELVETRSITLEGTGRVEFGAGIIGKLIQVFRDSPYIWQDNYAETMHELIEMFYYYKNETLDLVSDDNLVSFMKKCFDGKCQGSLELLKYRELDAMARQTRFGRAPLCEEDL